MIEKSKFLSGFGWLERPKYSITFRNRFRFGGGCADRVSVAVVCRFSCEKRFPAAESTKNIQTRHIAFFMFAMFVPDGFETFLPVCAVMPILGCNNRPVYPVYRGCEFFGINLVVHRANIIFV